MLQIKRKQIALAMQQTTAKEEWHGAIKTTNKKTKKKGKRNIT